MPAGARPCPSGGGIRDVRPAPLDWPPGWRWRRVAAPAAISSWAAAGAVATLGAVA